MFNTKQEYELSMSVKGYGVDYCYLKDKLISKEKLAIENKTKSDLLAINKSRKKDFDIKVIENLSQYLKIISKLPTNDTYPIFYRGQNNSNYLLVPSALRNNTYSEHKLIQEFSRRFPDELNKCNNAMEKLVLMQHYGLHTRCLDITQAPLPALYFACADFKKFMNPSQSNMDKWGEILLFQANNEEDQKYSDSNTVSIMANTAFLKESFSMKELEIRYKQDNHLGALEDYIDLKHVIKHSVIVRTAQNNPRIRNQQGAFILVNSNNICSLIYDRKNIKEKPIDGEYLLEEHLDAVLNDNFTEGLFIDCLIDLENNNGMKSAFPLQGINNIKYQKSNPYDQSDWVPEYIKKDPFDINRLFFRQQNGKRLVILIPPYAKQQILAELAQNNIREDYIYPDMDTVANELNTSIGN